MRREEKKLLKKIKAQTENITLKIVHGTKKRGTRGEGKEKC